MDFDGGTIVASLLAMCIYALEKDEQQYIYRHPTKDKYRKRTEKSSNKK